MTTIDLSTPPDAVAGPSAGLLDALPRRVALTLPELRLVAERAGGAPLPFDLGAQGDAVPAADLEGRLGVSRGSLEDRAYRAALSALHDATTTLRRRGLMIEDEVDQGLLGVVGLLATPTVALDVDLAVESARVKAWHRQSHRAVASLATSDGIVFELAWFPTSSWPAELARVAVVPDDLALRASGVPPLVDLPYVLLDAAVEATGAGRSDVLQVLVDQHSGSVNGPDGRPCSEAEATTLLAALGTEARGRLRAMVADVSDDPTTVVGVRSWVLLADGWHCLQAREDATRVVVRKVEPSELAADLATVLSDVVGVGHRTGAA